MDSTFFCNVTQTHAPGGNYYQALLVHRGLKGQTVTSVELAKPELSDFFHSNESVSRRIQGVYFHFNTC